MFGCSGESVEADGDVAQGGHDGGAGPYGLGVVLGEDDVADPGAVSMPRCPRIASASWSAQISLRAMSMTRRPSRCATRGWPTIGAAVMMRR
jgi:hypothetical protein